MKIKAGMEEKYKAYKDMNSKDPYSARVVSYGEDWANLMEAKINISNLPIERVLQECADVTSHEADTDGITGFMYGAAVSGLSQFWEYGEELRKWHNLDVQIGNEGERANTEGGVLNPAVLVLK